MKDDKSRVTNRPERVPVHKHSPLKAQSREGFVRRLVQDTPGRIKMFLAAGWTHVVDESQDISDKIAGTASQQGSNVVKVTNKDPRADSHHAYLLEIPEDLYNQDQADKMAQIDKKEAEYDPSKRAQGGADYGYMKSEYK